MLALVIGLGGCAQSVQGGDTPPKAKSSTVNATSNPVAGVSSGTVSEFKVDENIPDVVKSAAGYCDNSNRTLYEDADAVYFRSDGYGSDYGNQLYACPKNGGAVQKISDDCGCFTVNEGKVYYVTRGKTKGYEYQYYNTLQVYDVKTGRSSTLLKLKNDIYSIACHGGKLYYSYDVRVFEYEWEAYSELFCCNFDGTGIEKILEDAGKFYFDRDKIFFYCSPQADGLGPLSVYDMKSKKINEVQTTDVSSPTGNTRLGQYAFDLEDYASEDESETYGLVAYDTQKNKSYNLMDLARMSSNDLALKATAEHVYLTSMNEEDGSLELYRVAIENGKAGLQKVAAVQQSVSETEEPGEPSDSPWNKPQEPESISQLDKKVPDINSDAKITMIDSSIGDFAEDHGNFYYIDDNTFKGNEVLRKLYRCEGSTRKVVSEDSSCFTAGEGGLYYVEKGLVEGKKHYNTIIKYNAKTGKRTTLLQLKNEILNIACSGDRLYYTYNTCVTGDDAEPRCNLFSCDLGGGDNKKLIEDVNNFAVQGDGLYYTSQKPGKAGPLFMYNLKSGKTGQLGTNIVSHWNQDVKEHQIFYYESDIGWLALDAETGEVRLMPEAWSGVIAGQYLIECGIYASGDDQKTILTAYDIYTGKTYNLTDITEIDELDTAGLYAAGDKVYLSVTGKDKSLGIYRLEIRNGKAGLKEVLG